MIALWLVLSAAPPVCGEQQARIAEVQRYTSPEDFDAAVARLERELEARLGRHELAGDDRVEVLRARLSASCELFARTSPGGATADRERLAGILDRPEFSRARRPDASAIQALLARLNLWLKSMLETSGAATYASWARVVVLAVALAAAAGGLLRAVRWRRGHRAVTAEVGDSPLKLEDPSTHWALAEKALMHDGREAVRQALLCLLAALEQRRWARPDRVKTNRELAAELPSRGAPPELHQAVLELVRWYDRTFYSLEPVPANEAQRFVSEVGRLRARFLGSAG